MIILLNTCKLNEKQLKCARDIAYSEVSDMKANIHVFDESLKRTYLFKDFDMMKCFHEYLESHNIPESGIGFDEEKLRAIFSYYHSSMKDI